MKHPQPACWAVIPAAGVGTRMGSEIPKQYLELQGKSILSHSIERLGRHPLVKAVVVAIASDDDRWPGIRHDVPVPVHRAEGGVERCHSVLNGLTLLSDHARADDWVLVHDAVRPCVRMEDIDGLIDAVAEHPVGGLLGLRVRDTMKRADGRGAVSETVSREGLWHALTPQIFHVEALATALTTCISRNLIVTDEAQAMELTGAEPLMVEGHEDNIKITRPQDMKLAELYLASQVEAASR